MNFLQTIPPKNLFFWGGGGRGVGVDDRTDEQAQTNSASSKLGA